MTNLKHIYDALINFSQSTIDFQKLEEDLKFIEQKEQWSDLFTRANMHGILPLVYKTLHSSHLNIDEDVLFSFKQATVEIAKENMLMSSELLRVTKLFDAQQIPVTSFKGPTLSLMIHKDITLRQYSDLDLLIDETYLYEAAEILIKNGYQTDIDLKFLKNKQFILAAKDLPFTHPLSQVKIELHWKLFDPKFAIKSNDFFKLTQDIQLYNSNITTFDTTNLLVYLCMHGSKHYWERIEWIVDIDRLTREYEIEWEVFQTQVEQLEIKTLVYVGLCISSELFDTPIPHFIQKEMQEYQTFGAKIIETIYDDEIINEVDIDTIDLQSITRNISFKDTKSSTLEAKIRSYFQLKQGDITIVNLPNYLSWAYYPLRFIRITQKYLKRN